MKRLVDPVDFLMDEYGPWAKDIIDAVHRAVARK